MKSTILVVIFMVLGINSFSQNGVKLYGFIQDVLPGTIPKGTDENGQPIQARKSQTVYRIFLTGPSKGKIYPAEIWINGRQYAASYETIRSTPVEARSDNKTVAMVPKTSGQVIQVNPMDRTDGKKFPNAKAKAALNDVVIVYKLNGKFYSATLKKLVRLEPENNM